MRIWMIPVLALALGAGLVGCSQDSVTPENETPGLMTGQIDPALGDFTIRLETASTPDSLARGPFFLRGTNLHYDDSDGVLVVDLTITNNGTVAHRMPVAMTFFRFIPEDVTVFNYPDSTEFFTFDFANDDLWWTPGEESLPLRVELLVDDGVSVGFNAQLVVGGGPDSGAIAGYVWHDVNEDGVRDANEVGIPGVPVNLDDGSPQEVLVVSFTDGMGRYAFHDLEAGMYEVRVLTVQDLWSTTPSSMHVLLTEQDGGIARFDGADFGFVPDAKMPPGPRLTLGGKGIPRVVGYRGTNRFEFDFKKGLDLFFEWEGVSFDPGASVASYRAGMDVQDPDDPGDPGWFGPPGMGDQHKTFSHNGFSSGGVHNLVVDCQDTQGHLTRIQVYLNVND